MKLKETLAWHPLLFDLCMIFLLFLGFLLYLVPEQGADPDFWGRLSVPAYFYQTGHLPRLDPFSYTAYHHLWIDHEWLSGFVFYWILMAFGEPGILVFKYVLIMAAFAVLFSLSRRCHPDASPWYPYYGFLLLGPVYMLGYAATIRCQLFSFFFFCFFLWILEQVRLQKCSKCLLLGLFPISIIWANLHGGVSIGFVLVLLYGIGEIVANPPYFPSFRAGRKLLPATAWPYFLCAAGMLLVITLCNPYGWAYIEYLFYALRLDRSNITEWRPLPFGVGYWQSVTLILIILLLLGAHAYGFFRKAPEEKKEALRKLTTPSLVLLFLVMSTLKTLRFQTFLVFSTVAYLPLLISPVWFQSAILMQALDRLKGRAACITHQLRTPIQVVLRYGPSVFPILLAVFAVCTLILPPSHKPLLNVAIPDENNSNKRATHYPIGAIRFLQASPYHGRLMNAFTQGEFIYWNLYPKFLIAMDGRYEEVYSQQTFLDIHRFQTAVNPVDPKWMDRFLNKYRPDFILIEAKAAMAAALMDTGAWKTIYTDHDFALLARPDVLAQFPAWLPPTSDHHRHHCRITIQDFFHPDDLKRFGEQPDFMPANPTFIH